MCERCQAASFDCIYSCSAVKKKVGKARLIVLNSFDKVCSLQVICKGLHTHIHVHHTLHTSAMGSREETDSLLNGRSSMDLRRRCARQALICLPLGSEVGNMLTDDTWCGT